MLGAHFSKHVGVGLMHFRLQTTSSIFGKIPLETLRHLFPEWTIHEVVLQKVFQPAADYFYEASDVDFSKILNRAGGQENGRGSSSLCHEHFFLLRMVISSLRIGGLSVPLYTKCYSAQKILCFKWRIRSNEDFKMKLLGPRCLLSRFACLSEIYSKIHPSLDLFSILYIYILWICSILVRSP